MTVPVTTLKNKYFELPDELKQSSYFICWENRPGPDGENRKVPINPRTGRNANGHEYKNAWSDLATAVKYAEEKNIGVGFVIAEAGPYVVIDFDHCRDLSTGAIEPEILKIIRKLDSYTEISPSGAGLHVWLRVQEKSFLIGNRQGKIEIYGKERYMTVTGDHLPGTPLTIEDRQAEIESVHRAHIYPKSRPKPTPVPTVSQVNDADIDKIIAANIHLAKLHTGEDCGCKRADNSPSSFRFEYIKLLAEAGASDEQIDCAYRASKLYANDPDRWDAVQSDGRTFGMHEIDRIRPKANSLPAGVSLDDFVSYMPMHQYIFKPTGELWPGSSVNARLKAASPSGDPMKASVWLDINRPVEQMTWSPGEPMLIRDRIASEGGWIEHPGVNCFNLYRPPRESNGDPKKAGPWIEHIKRIYPECVDHIVAFLAHRVKQPQDKINHALVLGGAQGIGKDTLLDPVKEAVGPWNFIEISPSHLLSGFNGFVRSVILRISEARDLGDINRYSFYEHLKLYTASPPDVIRCNEKFLREYYVPNVCGVIITTNHKTDGVYLPADDRRHFIAWSNTVKEDFPSAYWTDIYRWYAEGGRGHVAAYLKHFDLSKFNAKEPPPKTAAFWEIVHASQAPENSDMSDAIDVLGDPPALTLENIISLTRLASPKGSGINHEFYNWLSNRKNARAIVFRLEECGYTAVRNPHAIDGRWRFPDGKKHAVYARAKACERDRIKAAKDLTGNKF